MDEVVVSVEEVVVAAVSEVVEVEVAEECVMKAHLMWLLVRLFSSHLDVCLYGNVQHIDFT